MTKIIKSIVVLFFVFSAIIFSWNCNDTSTILNPETQSEVITDGIQTHIVSMAISQNFTYYPSGGGNPSSRNYLLWQKQEVFYGQGLTQGENFTTMPSVWYDLQGGMYEHVNFQLYIYHSWTNAPNDDFAAVYAIPSYYSNLLQCNPPAGGTLYDQTFPTNLSTNTTYYDAKIGVYEFTEEDSK